MNKLKEYGVFIYKGLNKINLNKYITDEVINKLESIGSFNHEDNQRSQYYFPYLDPEAKRIYPRLTNLLIKAGFVFRKCGTLHKDKDTVNTDYLPYSDQYKEMSDILRYNVLMVAEGGNFFANGHNIRGNMLAVDKFWAINYKMPDWPPAFDYKGMQLVVIGTASLKKIVEYDGGKIAIYSPNIEDFFIPLANSFFEFLDMCFDKNNVVFEDGSSY